MQGEITGGAIVDKSAIQPVIELKKELNATIEVIDKLLAKSKSAQANLSIAKTVNKITTETEKLTKVQAELGKVQVKVALNAKTLWLSENEVAESMKRNTDATKKTGSALNELDKAQHKAANSATMMTGAQETLSKASKRSQVMTGSLTGEYKKLTSQLAENIKKYKDMAASGKATISALEKQRNAVVQLETKIRSIDNAVGQFQRNVGNYPKTFAAATSSLMQFVHAFGLIGGIYLFAKALKDAITATIDFEMANSRLLALLDGNTKGAEQLKKQQLELASSTLYSADQYAELQIELAKLGFTYQQIQKMTESTAKASIALGSDLAAQAELTGSIIHQYNLDANQTEKVNDQLSKATVKSALSFEKLATAMPYVGSAAAALGFDLSETLALMGQLANAGLGASTIGTSLRKIFLLLADSSSALSKKFKEPIRDLPALLKGLKELKLNNTDLAEALELTDVRSVVAFQSLIAGADKVEKLNKVIDESVGFTNALAKTVKDNLGGDLKLATSALTQLGITLGGVLNDALRTTVQGFTYFIRLLKELPGFIKENQGLILSLAAALVTLKIAAVGTNASLIAIRWNLLRKVVALKNAIAVTRAFTATLMANPLFVFAAAVTAVVAAFSIYDRTLGKTAKVNEAFTATNNLLNESIKNTEADLAKLTVSEQEYMRLKEYQIAVNEGLIEIKAQELTITRQLADANLKLAEYEAKQLDNSQKREASRGSLENQIKKTKEFEAANIANNETYQEQKKETDLLLEQLDEQIANNGRLKELYKGLAQLKTDIANKEKLVNNEDKLKAESKIIEDTIKLDNKRLKNAIDSQRKIADNENQSLTARQKALETIQALEEKVSQNNYDLALRDYRLSVALIKNEVDAKVITEKEGADKIKALNELTSKERKIILETLISDINQIEKNGIDERSRITIASQKANLQKEKEAAIIAAQDRQQVIQNQLDSEITAIQTAVGHGLKTREQGEKEIAAIQTKYNAELINQRIADSELMLSEIREDRKQMIDIISNSALEEVDKKAMIAELTKNYSEEEKRLIQEIFDLRNDLSDNAYNQTKSLYDKEIEQLERFFSYYQEYATSINALSQSVSDRKLANIERESRALKDYYDEQYILAGDNERYKDQLRIEQDRKEKELEKERLRAQKRQAVIQKVIALSQLTIQTAIDIAKIKSALAAANSAALVYGPGAPAIIAANTATAATQIALAIGSRALAAGAIAAAPLPGYEDGGKTSQRNIVAGEAGSELYRTPSGKLGITPGTATRMSLPVGTQIFPHDETVKMLAAGSMGRIDSVTPDYMLHHRINGLDKTIRETSAEVVNAIIENQTDYMAQGSLLLKIKKSRDGSKKITHSRAMGY